MVKSLDERRIDYFYREWIVIIAIVAQLSNVVVLFRDQSIPTIAYLLMQIILPEITILKFCLFLCMLQQRFEHFNNVIVPKVSWSKLYVYDKSITACHFKTLYKRLYNSYKTLKSLFWGFLFLTTCQQTVYVINCIVVNLALGTRVHFVELLATSCQMAYLCYCCHQTANVVSIQEI